MYEYARGAVLSWIIGGAKKFLESRCCIEVPAVVKEATEQYRAENDWLNNYISECCEIGKGCETPAGNFIRIILITVRGREKKRRVSRHLDQF